MPKLVLIDGNALVHRAFHALPPTLNSPQGVPTNAIYGFVSVLIKMIKDLKPEYIAATFDLAGPTFRHEEFADYKIHRVKAGFEADDLIGSLAENTRVKENLQIVIMTGDLDTLQLIEDDKVVVWTLRKGVSDTFMYNEKEVKKRYGLKPAQLLDFKGLKGDPSDNIPGVPGIGEKTAAVLIQKFRTLEKLYQEITKPDKQAKKTKIKPPLTAKLIEKLLDNKDQAFFSKKLATIIRDVEFDFDFDKTEWRKHTEREKLEKALKDLALFSLVKRLADIDEPSDKLKPGPVSLFETDQTGGSKLLATEKEAGDALKAIRHKDEIVLDVQNGLVLLGDGKEEIFGFPETVLDDGEMSGRFKEILEDKKIKKIGHDIKMICHWALERRIRIRGFSFDTKLAAYLINSERRDFSLERIYYSELNSDMDPEPLKRIAAIAELKRKLQPKIEKFELDQVLKGIELPLSPILAAMEHIGIKVNREALAELSKAVNKELETLEEEIAKLAGGKFNISSPKQLSVVLFDPPPAGLGLKAKIRKTGKGALSTAVGELEKLVDAHPIVALIMKHRELQKLKTTYIEPFPGLIKKDGRMHTTYNQTGAATGRLSSQDPNLQNIPVRTEMGQKFREAFIAEKGYALLSIDYNQLELRIAAHISGDKKMTETFKKREDIHTRTAAEIFDVKPDDVTPNMRRDAKALNFGVLYGMGVLGFQRTSGVSRDQAREFIQRYMREFSGVAEYIEKTRKLAHRQGYVATIFGRWRLVPEINSSMPQMVSQAERIAVNSPIQGTAADMIKIAMNRIGDFIEENYGPDDVRMLLQVHDELLFEIKTDLIKKVEPQLREMMENVIDLNVPITADSKVGKNWSEMRSLSADVSEQ